MQKIIMVSYYPCKFITFKYSSLITRVHNIGPALAGPAE